MTTAREEFLWLALMAAAMLYAVLNSGCHAPTPPRDAITPPGWCAMAQPVTTADLCRGRYLGPYPCARCQSTGCVDRLIGIACVADCKVCDAPPN